MLTDPAGTNDLTRDIIGCAIDVHREIGPGLLESAVQGVHGCRTSGTLAAILSRSVPCRSSTKARRWTSVIGWIWWLRARSSSTLKCVASLAPIHTAQLLTYLRLTKCRVGLLINFNVPVLTQGVKREVAECVCDVTGIRQATPFCLRPGAIRPLRFLKKPPFLRSSVCVPLPFPP